jgi:putative PEP-CTERM system histidine kinase
VLITLMVSRGRTSTAGLAILVCCVASLIWAGASALAINVAALALFDAIRLSTWLLFAVGLITIRPGEGGGIGRAYLAGALSCCLTAVANDGWVLAFTPGTKALCISQLLLRIGYGVAGLLTVENYWRNTEPQARWHVWPLCLAIGGLFAYELFLFSDGFITRGRVDPGLSLGQPIIAAFMVPLLALAMARNRAWRVDIHVSRQVVLHTATLVASGCFLLSVAVVGILLRGFGGDWGLVLQLAMLFGSIVVLVTVLSSGAVRRRLRYLISRNFFSHRYDYRVEWLKFIELVSEPKGGEELAVRIIRALAEFVDSPAGVLWSLSRGAGYYPTAAWKLPIPGAGKIAVHDAFVLGFRNGSWIQELKAEGTEEVWPFASAEAWLAVPLSQRSEIIGFVLLDRPAPAVALDWEVFDLLRAAGRQAASYLAEERSTKVLRDSELLTEYSKRFAFVVHDIKNLASQLDLIVSNARKYSGDPDFQGDMLRTVQDAVARMNKLLNQLKANAAPRQPRVIDPNLVIDAVVAEFAAAKAAIEVRKDAPGSAVAIDPDRLRSALIHLVQNAIDASGPGDAIMILSRRSGRQLLIEVIDSGPGMDACSSVTSSFCHSVPRNPAVMALALSRRVNLFAWREVISK